MNLLIGVGIAITADFTTGLLKAIITKQPVTSNCYKQTVIKTIQYLFAILSSYMLIAASKANHMGHFIPSFFNDALIGFIIFIEVTSIFENLYECDKTSRFSTLIIAPILRLLTFQLLHNPFKKISDGIKPDSVSQNESLSK